MQIKTGLLCLAILIPMSSFAVKGDFNFTVDGKINSFPSSCIKSIQYIAHDEIDSENLILTLTDECRKRISDLSRENIGKQMSISYGGNTLTTATIVSVLAASFRISAKNMPRVVLMQILDDYNVGL
ncbi:Insecticidal toxin complex protein tccz [Salmonella enterica subsp. diarizonae]|uniref:Insecticidal toxin complex protein tccz n=1 Tax=Salmonella enterica TaxID=28901 RepID=A0A750HY55_SALER|nr:Insecticidal toxin complex protein tccz [Salmonella enterica]EBQ5245787.1 Insecticidal toxin complex protein tccz [Salmonella enterica subsp. salamae]EDM1757741.1 Insecticidal toxin complex protein tccz [Salmonella enterica subsp. diarizonae]HAF6279781.1 Insecticidal toxin complex protein tccz [Salmonella enterica]